MPDQKISQLAPLPTPIQPNDVGVIVRGGVNYKFDKDDLPTPVDSLVDLDTDFGKD